MRESGEREERDIAASISNYGDDDEQNINRRSGETAKEE